MAGYYWHESVNIFRFFLTRKKKWKLHSEIIFLRFFFFFLYFWFIFISINGIDFFLLVILVNKRRNVILVWTAKNKLINEWLFVSCVACVCVFIIRNKKQITNLNLKQQYIDYHLYVCVRLANMYNHEREWEKSSFFLV